MKRLRHFFALLIAIAIIVGISGCSRDPNVRKQKYLESGKRFMDKQKFREAAIQFSNALQVDKNFADGHYQLAQAYAAMGAFGSAYAELMRTVELQPDNLQAQMDLGNILVIAGRAEDAKAKADLVLNKQPQNANAYVLLSKVYSVEGNLPKAIAQVETALKLAPDKADAWLEAGRLKALQSDLPGSEAAFKKAVELDGHSAGSSSMLALFYQQLQRYPEAEQELRLSIAKNPKNVNLRLALARLMILQTKPAEAEKVLTETKAALSDNPDGYRVLADYYVGTGQMAKAMTEVESLYREHKSDVRVKLNYVELLMRQRRIDEAQKVLQEVVKADRGNTQAQVFLAQIKFVQGHPSEAAADLDVALKNDPQNAWAHFIRGVIAQQSNDMAKAQLEWGEALRLRPTLVEAEESLAAVAIRQNDVERLAGLADDILRLQPDSATGYILRSIVSLNRRDLVHAEADLNRAILIAPGSPIPYVKMAKFRIIQKKLPESIAMFEKALQIDPNQGEALSGLASVYMAQKKPEVALQRVEQQITAAPRNPGFYLLAGQINMAMKNWKAAEAAGNKAIELEPSNTDAYLLVGNAQIADAREPDALKSWQRWMAVNSTDPRPYVYLGTLNDQMGNWQQAQQLYEKALQIAPEYADAANNLAFLMLTHGGNVDVALSLAQTARRNDPDKPAVADTLAYAYLMKGTYRSAYDLLKEAIAKSGEDPILRYHMGLVYEKMEKKADARNELKRALALNPPQQLASDVRSALTRVQ